MKDLFQSISERFDEKFGVMPEEDGGWMYPPSPVAVKSHIHQEVEMLLSEIEGQVAKQAAVHMQLAGEWTGIAIDGTKDTINPHQERYEELSRLLDYLHSLKQSLQGKQEVV